MMRLKVKVRTDIDPRGLAQAHRQSSQHGFQQHKLKCACTVPPAPSGPQLRGCFHCSPLLSGSRRAPPTLFTLTQEKSVDGDGREAAGEGAHRRLPRDSGTRPLSIHDRVSIFPSSSARRTSQAAKLAL
jgi:hypothetical protein